MLINNIPNIVFYQMIKSKLDLKLSISIIIQYINTYYSVRFLRLSTHEPYRENRSASWRVRNLNNFFRSLNILAPNARRCQQFSTKTKQPFFYLVKSIIYDSPHKTCLFLQTNAHVEECTKQNTPSQQSNSKQIATLTIIKLIKNAEWCLIDIWTKFF